MRRPLLIALVLLLSAVPAAHAAYPGENGKIAYVGTGSFIQDFNSIWTMNPDGSGKTQITSGGVDRSPVWSPDGTRIAFHRKTQGCTGNWGCNDIWIANADGTNPNLVVHGADFASWSPGGDQLVFMSGYDGGNGYGYIYKANTDGTGQVLLYDFQDFEDFHFIGKPAWAPDATATIAFHQERLYPICNPDPEPPQECAYHYPEFLYATSSETYTPAAYPPGPDVPGAAPNWSPDGTRLAFYTPWPDSTWEFPAPDRGGRIGVVNRSGSGYQVLTAGRVGSTGFDSQPAWSPDGTRIVFQRDGAGLHVINANGTGHTQVSTVGVDPDWQPVQRPNVRPKGASPFRASLVPAYQPCTTPNRVHGAPFSLGSCNPPQRASALSVGVGDGNPALSRSVGFALMKVASGDVLITLNLTNVMHAADRSEYLGELRGEVTVRLTDSDGPVATARSTTTDFPFGFTVPCAGTPGSSIDASTCSTSTSANAVVPGAIKDADRAIWDLGALRVYDGGPDEDADTAAGNSLFMTQGIFVP